MLPSRGRKCINMIWSLCEYQIEWSLLSSLLNLETRENKSCWKHVAVCTPTNVFMIPESYWSRWIWKHYVYKKCIFFTVLKVSANMEFKFKEMLL